MTKEEKLVAAKEANVLINSDHGVNAIMCLSDMPVYEGKIISTGSIGLDEALGIGGLPMGRVVEIYGPESSGKTTLCMHVIAEAQSKGGVCAMIDAEHAFDSKYATQLGINIDELMINQPDYGEQGLEILDRLINTGLYDVIVIDSVAALTPKAELEGNMGDSKMGLHARLMSQALRKITSAVHKKNVLVIFINQLRDKIGVMFGNPETTTGGNALKFYASVRLDVRRSTTAENSVTDKNKEKIGNQTTVKVIKNKVAPPFKKAEFNIIYGQGIDKMEEVIRIGSKKNVLKKWGDKITYNGDKYTIQQFSDLLFDNEEFYKEVRSKFYADSVQGGDLQPVSEVEEAVS